MTRTRRRPLPAHEVEPERAVVFGLALGVLSFIVMVYFVNLTAAFLTLLAIGFYVVVYTILLKRTTPQNIVIGGAGGGGGGGDRSGGRILSMSWRSAAASTIRRSMGIERPEIRAASHPATSATARECRTCQAGGWRERSNDAASVRDGTVIASMVQEGPGSAQREVRQVAKLPGPTVQLSLADRPERQRFERGGFGHGRQADRSVR